MYVLIDSLQFWKQCGETCKDLRRPVLAHENRLLKSQSPSPESGRKLATTAVVSVGNCQERNACGRETNTTCARSLAHEFWNVAIAVQFKRLPVELHCFVLKLVGGQCVAFCLRDQCDFSDLLCVGIDDQERDAVGMVPQTVRINIKGRVERYLWVENGRTHEASPNQSGPVIRAWCECIFV